MVPHLAVLVACLASSPCGQGELQGPPAAKAPVAEVSLREPRHELYEETHPLLSGSTIDAEALWDRMTSPETPYVELRVLARQVGKRFPIELVPRLYQALDALLEESWLHRWGLEPPDEIGVAVLLTVYSELKRERTILGRTWLLPEERSPFPRTWEAMDRAPWPLRVHNGLRHIGSPRGATERAAKWLEAAMTMPVDSAEEVRSFWRATKACPHLKSMEVLGRWYRIALDERFPETARFIAGSLGETSRLWDDERGRRACRVLAEDLLRDGPHDDARTSAAWQLGRLRERFPRSGNDERGPLPAGALLAAGPEVRLGDGLAALTAADRPEVLVMSGLGARSMLHILEAGAPRVGRLRRLVFQPQTEAGRLRRWIARRGFTIAAERMILERRRFYVVIAAETAPRAAAPPPHPSLSADDLAEAGPLLVRSGNPLVTDYWRRTLARLDDALSGATNGPGRRRTAESRARAARVLAAIEERPAERQITPPLL